MNLQKGIDKIDEIIQYNSERNIVYGWKQYFLDLRAILVSMQETPDPTFGVNEKADACRMFGGSGEVTPQYDKKDVGGASGYHKHLFLKGGGGCLLSGFTDMLPCDDEYMCACGEKFTVLSTKEEHFLMPQTLIVEDYERFKKSGRIRGEMHSGY